MSRKTGVSRSKGSQVGLNLVERNSTRELDSLRRSALYVDRSNRLTLAITEAQRICSAATAFKARRRARQSAAGALSNNRSSVVRRALDSSARSAAVSCIKQHRTTSAAKQAALMQH
ncbi:hypothetical protein ACLKA6_008029 [Drosophila palustris]